MGITFSCPFAEYSDGENNFESVIVKSISFGGSEEQKTPVRSISFKTQHWEPTIMKSLGSGNMVIGGSVTLKGSELDRIISIKSLSSDNEKNVSSSTKSKEMENNKSQRSDITPTPQRIPQLTVLDPSNPKHEAAIKLQKVYKSFRTRRKLADCAVLVEQSWWKLLDFAELKRSSISFFEIEKHESAISRWSRARTRAAKVGKGLSKNDKAQKLALQHWLEAIDPRHRYGHNLHFYYVKWLHCQSREPFFYWLDIGEGKEVNLVEKCPRSKLQQQCIKYLGPMERTAYEVVVEDGKFLYKKSGELLHTTTDDAKWIFVLSTSKTLYAGKKKRGTFQHSSFLAGGATSAAGRLVVENGILKAVWPHSGHYRPTEENFKDFISFLRENNVDLTNVTMSPIDDEKDSSGKRSSGHLRSNSSDEDFTKTVNDLKIEEMNVGELGLEKINTMEQEAPAALKSLKSRRSCSINKKLTDLEIPKRGESFAQRRSGNLMIGPSCSSPADGYETVNNYTSPKHNWFGEEHEEMDVETVPEESILRRINSHKGLNSYQLGKQLSCKWTSGAGPRIGCVRDYPSKLQFQALELVNLSPRSSTCHSRSYSTPWSGWSPKVLTPTCTGGQIAPTGRPRRT